MYGWIQDCIEALVLEKFGRDVWHKIKLEAGVQAEDGTFVRYKYYDDAMTYQLVGAACKVSGLTADQVLETFGRFFLQYVQKCGFSSLLSGQGSDILEFLQNMNAMHYHLIQSSLHNMVPPDFRAQRLVDGRIQLEYWSEREGLASLVVGCVHQAAEDYFNHGVRFEPYVTTKVEVDGQFRNYTCFTFEVCSDIEWRADIPEDTLETDVPFMATYKVSIPRALSPYAFKPNCVPSTPHTPPTSGSPWNRCLSVEDRMPAFEALDFATLFPFHIALDSSMHVLFVGCTLSKDCRIRIGDDIAKVVRIVYPKGVPWQADSLRRVMHNFVRLQMIAKPSLELIGGIVAHGPKKKGFLFIGSINASTFQQLKRAGYSLGSLPVHDPTRKVILQGEQLHQELESAKHMEQVNIKLSEKSKQMVEEDLASEFKIFLLKGIIAYSFKVVAELYDVFTDIEVVVEAFQDSQQEDLRYIFLIFVVIAAIMALYVVPSRLLEIGRNICMLISGKMQVLKTDSLTSNVLLKEAMNTEERSLQEAIQRLQKWERACYLGFLALGLEDVPMVSLQIAVLKRKGAVNVDSALTRSVFTTLVCIGINLGMGIALSNYRTLRKGLVSLMEHRNTTSSAMMQKYRNNDVNKCPVTGAKRSVPAAIGAGVAVGVVGGAWQS